MAVAGSRLIFEKKVKTTSAGKCCVKDFAWCVALQQLRASAASA